MESKISSFLTNLPFVMMILFFNAKLLIHGSNPVFIHYTKAISGIVAIARG